jgi:hypothetical protein
MVSKKTEPMFLGVRPSPGKGRRNTDLMGGSAIEEPAFRDTIKQDRGPLEDLLPSQPATPLPRGGTMPVSARIESLEADVPIAPQPQPVGGRIDVSKADPRRAPTQRVAKRPMEALEPDWSVAHRAPAPRPQPIARPAAQQKNDPFMIALAVFVALAAALVAAVIYFKVLR